MNNWRLHRANSFIRARKERAGNLLKKQHVTNLQRHPNKLDGVSSFLTIPNAFLIPLEAGHDSAANHSFRDYQVV